MVFYMANRLMAYIDFMHKLPTTLTRSNFEAALVEFYAHILQFLARAIQIYRTPSVKRAFAAAFGEFSNIENFERNCDKLGTRVEIEASNCDRMISEQKLQKVLVDLEQQHKFQDSLDRLETNFALDKLPYAIGAIFDSYDQVHVACHPATRVDLLRQIQDWAQQPQSKNIFWLNGMAGTGKSTISWTIAKWLTYQGHLGDIDLGASFFFKRGEGDRGSALRFFPTITRQLVSKIPELVSLVLNAITADHSLCNKSLGEQFEKLIYQPLQTLTIAPGGRPTLIVVVDALDECEDDTKINELLQLWSRLSQITTVRIKLFLTSRPDLPVRLGFKRMSADAHRDMVLQDEVPRTTIQHDISAFLRDAFAKIRTDSNLLLDTPFDPDWPSEKVIQELADVAVPLFIIAATICRFVGDRNWDPREQLETILRFPGVGQMSQMEQTYLPVLHHMSATLREAHDKEKLYQEFQIIIGSVVVLAEPLSITSLAALLEKPSHAIKRRLNSLHSVLHVPVDHDLPVRTLHLSFTEFLLNDQLRDQSFRVDGPTTHRMLFIQCLKLLSGPDGLHEDICNLRHPGQLRGEIDSIIIRQCLSPASQYACRYWVHHVQHSMDLIRDDGEVHIFLMRHFLHWFEALSLMDCVAEVIKFVDVLRPLIVVSDNPEALATNDIF